jgi:hypothetical protein
MADYVTVEEVKADVPDSPLFDINDSTYDEVLGNMITAASRLIDKAVGGWANYFYPTTDSQTRYFDGSGSEVQYIDPAVSITSVAVSGSGRAVTDYTAWTADSDYFVAPYNHTAIGYPITNLVVDNDSGSKGTWGKTKKGVKVTGIFGWSLTPPADVEQACKIQAVRWFMRAKQGYQDAAANPNLGEMVYMQELDPDVKMLLRPYQLHNIVWGE